MVCDPQEARRRLGGKRDSQWCHLGWGLRVPNHPCLEIPLIPRGVTLLGGMSSLCCFPTSSHTLSLLWINSHRKGAFVSSSIRGMALRGTNNPVCKHAERLDYKQEAHNELFTGSFLFFQEVCCKTRGQKWSV